MCNVIGCANFDNPPLCTECQWTKDQVTARVAELEADYEELKTENIEQMDDIIQANAVITVLADQVASLKNQYENEDTTGDYEVDLAEQQAKEGE